MRHHPVSPPPIPVTATPGLTRISFLVADDSECTRVGGAPSWVQHAESVSCPTCGSLMLFIAQVADPPDDLWSGDGGLLYAFLCSPCRVLATISQCT